MAFKPPKKPPQFADLKGILAQSKEIDNPLYQVVEQIIDRLTQYQFTNEENLNQRIEITRKLIVENLPDPTPPPEGDILETDIVDGALLARVADDETISGEWTFETDPIFNPGAIPEVAIHNDALLARNADNETITGSWTYTNQVTLQNNNPILNLVESDGPTHEKFWRIYVDLGNFNIQSFDDALGTPQTPFQITKVGALIENINFFTAGVLRTVITQNGTLYHAAGLRLAGRSAVSVTGDQTAWNPTGLGTVYNIVANATAPLTLRGILAQLEGYIVVITNVGSVITVTHNDAAASGANRILTPGGATFTVPLFGAMTLIYDTSYVSWRVIGKAV